MILTAVKTLLAQAAGRCLHYSLNRVRQHELAYRRHRLFRGLRRSLRRDGIGAEFSEEVTDRLPRVGLGVPRRPIYGVPLTCTTLRKIIGGGMPVGCFRRANGRFMEVIAPTGSVIKQAPCRAIRWRWAAGTGYVKTDQPEPGFHDELTVQQPAACGVQEVLTRQALPFVTNPGRRHVWSVFFRS